MISGRSGNKASQRIFVGIKVSNEIAEACRKMLESLKGLPARFVPPESVHLTLVPPWQMEEGERCRLDYQVLRSFNLHQE